MKAFEGKIIKLYLNATSGYLTLTGKFVDMDEDFVVIENSIAKNIQYFNKAYIKYIEIVKEIEVSEYEYDK